MNASVHQTETFVDALIVFTTQDVLFMLRHG